jgi:hypothetical protein
MYTLYVKKIIFRDSQPPTVGLVGFVVWLTFGDEG